MELPAAAVIPSTKAARSPEELFPLVDYCTALALKNGFGARRDNVREKLEQLIGADASV